MDKKILFLAIATLLIVMIILGVYNQMKYRSEAVRIIVYRQGVETKLNPESNLFIEVQKKCENLFIDADNALLLAVTKRTIDKVKETTAVEILYSEPKEFMVHLEKPYIRRVNALLISFNNKSVVIYYGVNGSYSSGPLVNTKEEDIMSLLHTLTDSDNT